MDNFRHFFFLTLAFLALPIVMATFICNYSLAAFFIHATKMEIAPQYSGGKVQTMIDHGTYFTILHEPVAEEWSFLNNKRFVQVDWQIKGDNSWPLKIHENLPEMAVEISWNTSQKEAEVKSPSAITSTPIYELEPQKKMLRFIFKK